MLFIYLYFSPLNKIYQFTGLLWKNKHQQIALTISKFH